MNDREPEDYDADSLSDESDDDDMGLSPLHGGSSLSPSVVRLLTADERDSIRRPLLNSRGPALTLLDAST